MEELYLDSIKRRNRWNKIYDRKLSFDYYQDSSEIVNDPSGDSSPSVLHNEEAERLSLKFIFIKPRGGWSKLYDRSFNFMQWAEPEESSIVDEISCAPLSHIALLCKNMICATCKCTICVRSTELFDIFSYCELANSMFGVDHVVSGSYSEGCPLPPYIVEVNPKGKKAIECSDVDVMACPKDKMFLFLVGFDRSEGSDIKAVIETTHTYPGYLRLRGMDGHYIHNNPGEKPGITGNFSFEMTKAYLADFSKLEMTHSVRQHGPALGTDMNHLLGTKKFDLVWHYPCASWPPEAKPWINRFRPSNWPTRETRERIVSKGCSVVSKPHPTSKHADLEFRYSFSNAEVILFKEMSIEQKNCFVAFKAIVKRVIHKMENKYEEEMQISTYHLKTIFMWACETISEEQWNSTRGWAGCFLFLLDQFILCLENKSLPSYFIPQCNLLDGIKLFQSLHKMIKRIRLKPLKYAAEFVDSMALFYTNKDRNRNMSTNLYILLCSSVDSGCNTPKESSTVSGRNKALSEIFESECRFLQKQFQSQQDVTLWNDIFKRKNCGLLASFANWCKENKDRIMPFFKEMTLFDVICLENIHGLRVPNNILNHFFEQESSINTCSIGAAPLLSDVKESLLDPSMHRSSLLSKLLIILHSLNSEKIGTARVELGCLINIALDDGNDIYFDADRIADEAGYWLFSSNTTKLIREYKNIFKNKEVSVSVEMFSRFLLSMCHRKLGDEQGLDFQFRQMIKVSHNCKNSTQYLGNLLLVEVAEMIGNAQIVFEICKSTLMFIVKAIDDLMYAETKASKEAHTVLGEIGRAVPRNQFKNILEMWSEGAFGDDREAIEAFDDVARSRYSQEIIFNCLQTIDDCATSACGIARQLTTDTDFRKSCKLTPEINTEFNQENMREIGNVIRSGINADLTNRFFEIKNKPPSNEIRRSIRQSFRDNKEILLQFYDFMHKDENNVLITSPVRYWFISGCNFVKFAFENIHDKETKGQWSSRRFTLRFMLRSISQTVFSNKHSYTISDAVYIAQDMIHADDYQVAITILEEVVSKEFTNPLSVIVWPAEFIELVDDTIKREIRESRNGCIVLPSVVYALYLLARVYHSIGNREAFEETQVRLEYICDYMGDDSLISKRLLELVNNSGRNQTYEDLELD